MNQKPKLSRLNRIAFVLWFLPKVLMAIGLACTIPFMLLWGLIQPRAASRFMGHCEAVLDSWLEEMKRSKARLAKK